MREDDRGYGRGAEMDKEIVLKSARLYADAVLEIMHPYAIVLYGSFVTGGFNDSSDINIAVVTDGFDGDYLMTSKELWRLTADIDDSIEPILLDKRKDKSGFVADVLKRGEYLFISK